MVKFSIGITIWIIFLILGLFSAPVILAEEPAFVSIINPIRGADFWEIKGQQPETAIEGQIQILKKFDLKATWLLRFDALNYKNIVDDLNKLPDEKGLFLEVVPSWASAAGIQYQKGESWHDAKSAFLTGYDRFDREKLIDAGFEKFKQTFGAYPKSVGAWWLDAYSLDYMQKKYGITSSMIVSDQYTTDNYQIWGQYFSTPYYPAKNNALHPAQTLQNKLPVVMLQWAPRDPVNSYGNGVFESTFSVQANDYLDYHNLDTKYFSNLLDLYTNQKFNKFSQLVVGLENSYLWEKYSKEYENQMKVLFDRRQAQKLSVISMEDFASWYKQNFPELSPTHLIIADDLLGSFKKVVWFMDSYYRVGWFLNNEGSLFRDIRQYVDGEEELCFREKCDQVNFATSATRVLDEVSFGQKLLIDQGKVKNFNIGRQNDKIIITYQNEAGKIRNIGFLPRDIEIDGKTSSIDTTILEATKNKIESSTVKTNIKGTPDLAIKLILVETVKFLAFLIICILIPGLVLAAKTISRPMSFLQKIFLSAVIGLVSLVLIFYLLSLLKIRPLIYGYFFVTLLIFFKYYFRSYKHITLSKIKSLSDVAILTVIIIGTFFQVMPTFQSGLKFAYGLGFWGPNTHDGLWHLSLINQLMQNLPPENPIFSGIILKNYHYFYDLLVAITALISKVTTIDLLFRFYPLFFSILLGIGTYYLIGTLLREKMALARIKIVTIFSLYFVYFAGSFGWIVEYLRERHWGGESAFWANQSISFNLNPPFAVSLIIVIAIIQLTTGLTKRGWIIVVLTLLTGSLISFKAYAGILILLTFLIISILKRSLSYLLVFLFSSLISGLLFLSSFSYGQSLMLFAPFWFINSMIDSPDRVGWTRLSLTRTVGLAGKNWFKFLGAEFLSLLIFIAGNLGARILSLLALAKIKTIYQDNTTLFLLVFSSLSLIIPILFIQAGNPWNTIQFFYYFLYIAAIINGIVIFKLADKSSRVITTPLVLFIFAITPINSWATARGYLTNQPHAYINTKEMEGLEFLRSQPSGVVLTYPYDSNLKKSLPEPWPLFVYDSTAYVSALTNKPSFLEDEAQNQILLTDYKKKLIAAKDFFSKSANPDIGFLQANRIQYIYLPKIFKVRLYENASQLKNIWENDQVIIYQVEL